MIFEAFLPDYFETDMWRWPLIAIASLGAFWVYHRRVLSKISCQQLELIENEHWLLQAQQIANIGSWYRHLESGKSRWSPQLHCIYGVPESEAPSFEMFCKVVHPDDRIRVEKSIRQIEKTGVSTVLNFRVKRADGSVAYVENRVNGAFDSDNNLVAVYGSVLDVTERRAYEDSLKRVIQDAESANRAKGAFLSSVSHEILTPLNAIIGFSTLMAEQKLNAEQYKSYGESINIAGKSLSALINDILDLSALESLSFTLVPLNSDIQKIMDDVYSVFELIVSGKGIALNMNVDERVPLVRIDGKRLRQILINIIGNAVKFTDEGSVDIQVTADKRPDGHADCDLTFRISDTGIGINSIDQSRIFREFEQARGDVNRRFGGSGLGLSIVTQLLELMGGTIELESEVGKGSVFTLKFYNLPVVGDDEPAAIEEGLSRDEFQGGVSGDYGSGGSILNNANSLLRKGEPIDLDSDELKKLRSAFGPRFALLAKGVNIEFARALSTDVHSWAVEGGSVNCIKFSENLFKYTSSMNVGELLRISSIIAAE